MGRCYHIFFSSTISESARVSEHPIISLFFIINPKPEVPFQKTINDGNKSSVFCNFPGLAIPAPGPASQDLDETFHLVDKRLCWIH